MEEKRVRSLKWNIKALEDYIKILDHIRNDSPGNALKVEERITAIINEIPSSPKMFRADELKTNNDGSFRVFNKNSIRVSYQVSDTEILIARFEHASRKPYEY
jgi:plasmid stabilization system protein ParE